MVIPPKNVSGLDDTRDSGTFRYAAHATIVSPGIFLTVPIVRMIHKVYGRMLPGYPLPACASHTDSRMRLS